MINLKYRPRKTVNDMKLPIFLKSISSFSAKNGWQEIHPGKSRTHCNLFWCVSGNAKMTIGDKVNSISSGDFVYCLKFEPHRIHVTEKSFTYYWYALDGTLATEIIKAYDWPRTALPAGTPPKDLMSKITANFDDLSEKARFNDSNLAVQLLNFLAFRIRIHTKSSEEKIPETLQLFLNAIDKNYNSQDFTLGKIASEFCIHRSTLHRLVRKYYGISPEAFLDQYRIQIAIRQLLDTRLTAAEIATNCGFSSAQYFSRRFRVHTGMSPLNFRRRNQ